MAETNKDESIKDESKKKMKLSATISPYLKKRVDELVESGVFVSASEFTGISFAEFLGRYDMYKEITDMAQQLEEQNRELENIKRELKGIKENQENQGTEPPRTTANKRQKKDTL